MTWVGQAHALRLRRALGLAGPVSARAVSAMLNIPVYSYSFAGDVIGCYSGGEIGIRPLVSPPLREHVLLHEIGHHLIHGPKASTHFWRARDRFMVGKMDHHADCFAMFFALPDAELLRLLCREVPHWEIAKMYTRTPEWILARTRLSWDAPGLMPLRRQDWIA